MQRSAKHLMEYVINIEESPLKPLPLPTIEPGFCHKRMMKKYVGAGVLRTEEWFRFPVCMSAQWSLQVKKDYVTNEAENQTQKGVNGDLFHGCPFGAFLGMLAKGGFVAGEGCCRRKTRSVIGAFCTTDFFAAFSKGKGQLPSMPICQTGSRILIPKSSAVLEPKWLRKGEADPGNY